jgi:hypothetical protein
MSIVELPPTRTLSDERVAVISAAVAAELAEVSRPRRRFPRIFSVIAAGVGVATLGAGAAAAYIALRPAHITNKQTARCYTAVTYTKGTVFPGTTVAQFGSDGNPGQVENAIDTCAALWRTGILERGMFVPVLHPAPGTHVVPPLVACVLPGGAAAIYPGPADTCVRLGLAPAVTTSTASTSPVSTSPVSTPSVSK